MKRFRAILTVALALVAVAVDGHAGQWPAAGLVFSDELGGFEILSVAGTGTLDDPIAINQRITGTAPAVMSVRFDPVGGLANMAPRQRGYLKLAVVSRILNASRKVWAGFDFELQEALGQPSVYRDGLSFDQVGSFSGRVFYSDRFARFTDLIEPYDRIRFEGGSVDAGDSVLFAYFITDVTPRDVFYLLQEPKVLTAALPLSNRVASR